MQIKLVVCLALALSSACSQTESVQNSDLAAAAIISSGAVSNDLALTRVDYQAALAGKSKEALQQLLNNSQRIQEFVLDYHSDRVLAAVALRSNVQNDPSVQSEIEGATRRILITKLVAQTINNYNWPGDESIERLAKEHYALKKDTEYRISEQREVSHILVSARDCPCETQTPMQRAQALYAQLRDGAVFAELAKANSADKTSAARGGKLQDPVMRDGKTVEKFEKAVFALSTVQNLSEPFETQFGVHIVKLDNIIAPHTPPYDELRERLIKLEKKKLIEAELSGLRSGAYPKPDQINHAELNQLILEAITEKP